MHPKKRAMADDIHMQRVFISMYQKERKKEDGGNLKA